MDITELKSILEYSKKYNLWSNPNKKEIIYNDEEKCEYCGKKLGNNRLFVHITTDGVCLPNSINIIDQSQGCFPIGSECAKKLFGKDLDKYTIKIK